MKLSKVENQNIEFKQSWRDEYLKWICAFANSEGGILYIGVKDNGEICGVEESHKLTEDIPNKIRNTMGLICDVKLQNDNDLEYFEIVVEKYPFPVSYHGKYYKRTGSTIQELSGIELDKMILYVQGRTWDSIPVPNVKIDDLENDAFKLFRKKASDSGRLDKDSLEVTNETLLQNLHLFEGENLNRAAILGFHSDPEKWVTGAYIKIAFFENEADILYQDEVHGPLILQVEKTIELIYSKYMKALISYDDIYRKETFFFPRAAFRELLLNAVIHKDYLSTTPIQIRIYQDKIRLWNDGGLPKEVPLENLFKEHISKPCNPNLANVFFKCGMIESWGRGFEKIANYCAVENAKLPEIDLSLGGVTARCFASDFYLGLMREHNLVNEKDFLENGRSPKLPRNFLEISSKLPRSSLEVFKIICNKPNATNKEIGEELEISDRAVRNHIKVLKDFNVIKRIGSDRSGYWEIITEEK